MKTTDETMPIPSDRFRQNVLRLRLERGWSKAELARRAGLSESGIGRIERGERTRTPWPSVVALAKAFGCDPKNLAGASPDEPIETEPAERLLAGIITAGELLQIYIASPWHRADRPTAEELEWLAGLGGVIWTKEPPTAEVVHELIEQRRAGNL